MADSWTVVNTKDSHNVVVTNTVPVQGALKVGDTVVDANPEMRPVMIGAKATSSVAQRTLVADSRMMGVTVTPDGRVIIVDVAPGDCQLASPVAAPTNGNTTDFALLTQKAALVKNGLYSCDVMNLSGVTTWVILKSPALGELGRFAIPVGGSKLGPWKTPKKGAAAESMNLRLNDAVSANTLWFTPDAFITKD